MCHPSTYIVEIYLAWKRRNLLMGCTQFLRVCLIQLLLFHLLFYPYFIFARAKLDPPPTLEDWKAPTHATLHFPAGSFHISSRVLIYISNISSQYSLYSQQSASDGITVAILLQNKKKCRRLFNKTRENKNKNYASFHTAFSKSPTKKDVCGLVACPLELGGSFSTRLIVGYPENGKSRDQVAVEILLIQWKKTFGHAFSTGWCRE